MVTAGSPHHDEGADAATLIAAYEARIRTDYEGLDMAGKGALLRREGRYTSLISAWVQRDQRDA
ncbi:hypothetical protein GCM10010169_63770 [Micromonospora fulviviridis]|nr:hypothetical protein GCM10010169_63770 [Micromonospora fulviviridis]